VDFVRTPDDRFNDLVGYPFEPRYVELSDGLRMHYVEAGPSGGEPVLLLHGQPTWSYLYRTMISTLAAQGFRAIAPDMIGFGRSDKPTARTDYSVRRHTDWLVQLITTLSLRRITMVVQDWGGPVGLGALVTDPERFARIVASNTALHTADPSLAGHLAWDCHTDAEGSVVVDPTLLDYQRMTQELSPFRPSLFVQGATTSTLSDDVCAGYDAPFPDEQSCAGVRQLPLLMGLTPNSAAARHNSRIFEHLASATQPLLTAFSDGDPATRGWDVVLHDRARGAIGQAHHSIEGAGHFVQEDRGDALADAIAAFVRSNPVQ
jgi:haloalkane dehalogenase